MSLLLLFKGEPPVAQVGDDSGVGVDQHLALATTGVGTDTGTGTDQHVSLAVALVASDAATGTDATLSLGYGDADAGTGIDTGTLLVSVSASDAGTGADDGQLKLKPMVAVEVWENGVFRQSLGTYMVDAVATLDLAFDASLLSDPTGAGMEVRLHSTSAFDVSAMAWDAEYLSAGAQVDKDGDDSGTGLDTALLVVTHTGSDSASSIENAWYVGKYASSDSGTGTEAVTRQDRTVTDSDQIYPWEYEVVLKPPKGYVIGKQLSLVGRASFDLQ